MHIVEHAKDAWESLRNARIFITGGTGFFGKWLIESIVFANQQLKLNIDATVLSRNPSSFLQQFPHLSKETCLHFCEGDVRNFTHPIGKFSHVIHAATEASAKLNAENPTEMMDVILNGTKNTLDFAVKCGAKNILLTSSGAVYGRQPPEILNLSEEYDGSPDMEQTNWAYGMGKRASEYWAMLYAKQFDLNLKIGRFYACLGPHLPLDIHFAMGNFIRDAMQKRPIAIAGDGTPYRSYQYISDLMVWLLTIFCFGKNNVPYNVGSDEAISILETAKKVSSFFPGSEIIVANSAKPKVLPERYVPSVDRAKQDLKLKNRIPLNEAILKTIQWYQQEV